MRRLTAIVAIALLAGSCSSLSNLADRADEIIGSGVTAVEVRQVDSFDAIRFKAVGDVQITTGSGPALTIEADDNLLDKIQSEVTNGTLVISIEKGFSLVPARGATYEISVPSLSELEVSGVGDLTIDSLSEDEFTLSLSGVGDVTLTEVDLGALTVRYSGVGEVTISGTAESQDVKLSGVGSYHADDLKSTVATVSASGTGGATIWVTDELTVTASGIGVIKYWGEPPVTRITASGIGGVQSLGSK